jgi:hypothetical protein
VASAATVAPEPPHAIGSPIASIRTRDATKGRPCRPFLRPASCNPGDAGDPLSFANAANVPPYRMERA